MADIGPVEYMAVAFPGNEFSPDFIPALRDLVNSKTVRIIDLAFVHKDGEGNLTYGELEDFDSKVGAAFRAMEAEVGELVSEDDLILIGDELGRNSSALIIVWEDLWAARLAGAIRESGGVILGLERIPYPAVEAALEAAGIA